MQSYSSDLTVFYDGDCPLCRREIDWLQRRDSSAAIRFVDIASPDFQPADWGQTRARLMAQLHAVDNRGRWLVGVEVFRRMYTAVGLGWLVAPTRLPIVRGAVELAYRIFARYRTRLPGRRCRTGACHFPPREARVGSADSGSLAARRPSVSAKPTSPSQPLNESVAELPTKTLVRTMSDGASTASEADG